MYDMLRHMSPPLGLGKRCPARVAYKVRKAPIFISAFDGVSLGIWVERAGLTWEGQSI